jgi:hypothetical protein
VADRDVSVSVGRRGLLALVKAELNSAHVMEFRLNWCRLSACHKSLASMDSWVRWTVRRKRQLRNV